MEKRGKSILVIIAILIFILFALFLIFSFTLTGRVIMGVYPTPGDVNDDGRVDISDLLRVAWAWGKSAGQNGFNENADFNRDGTVNVLDLLILAQNFGRVVPTGSLNIISEPEGAIVYAYNNYEEILRTGSISRVLGRTPLNINLPVGNYEIVVWKEHPAPADSEPAMTYRPIILNAEVVENQEAILTTHDMNRARIPPTPLRLSEVPKRKCQDCSDINEWTPSYVDVIVVYFKNIEIQNGAVASYTYTQRSDVAYQMDDDPCYYQGITPYYLNSLREEVSDPEQITYLLAIFSMGDTGIGFWDGININYDCCIIDSKCQNEASPLYCLFPPVHTPPFHYKSYPIPLTENTKYGYVWEAHYDWS